MFQRNHQRRSAYMFKRISFLEKLLFTKHLATMIKAGIPIAEALDTLMAQTRSKAFKRILSAVSADIANGQALAKSLGKHPKIFDQFYISLIEVGEESGTLEENLQFLAKQLAKDYALRKKIKGAMLYPGLVFSATFIMGGFIALFILPQLVDFFEAFEVELPLTTRILLFAAATMKNYGILLFSCLLVFMFLCSLVLQIPAVKLRWHRIVLKLPILGDLITFNQLARFSRNFGTLLKSGIPISRALQVTGDTLSNMAFKQALEQAEKNVTKGKELAKALETFHFSLLIFNFLLFPPIVSKMIGVGEKTGKLDEVLLYLGDFYEEEIDSISKNLSTILEPILLITIGLVVGFVALAIISPIYELTGSIRRK